MTKTPPLMLLAAALVGAAVFAIARPAEGRSSGAQNGRYAVAAANGDHRVGLILDTRTGRAWYVNDKAPAAAIAVQYLDANEKYGKDFSFTPPQ
jgi:hypothetical protein